MPNLASDPFAGMSLTPVHTEAYPSFAIKTADSYWRVGVLHCEWEGRFGELVGQIELKALRGDDLQILYSCGSRTYLNQQGLGLRIARCRLISNRLEARVFCPACDQIKDRLFFRWQRWACQRCQQLVQRRSLLTATEKAILQREQLIRKVHGPGSETRSSLATLRERQKLVRLNEMFADAGVAPRLGYPLAYTVGARWFANEDDRTGPEHAEEAPHYLDEVKPA